MLGFLQNFRREWPRLTGLCIAVLLVISVASCSRWLVPQAGWSTAAGPVVPHDTFPADCTLCHTGKDWKTIRNDFSFDHEARTGVALVDAHKNVSCLLCHNDRGPVKQFAARGCAGCHVDPHRAMLGSLCSDCHNEQTWRPKEAIARHNLTRFPLVGAHASAACFSCHPGAQVGTFAGNDTRCVSCHQKDLVKTTTPDHQAQGWTSDCQTCHTPTGWNRAFFKHDPGFPLTGGHRGLDCTQCHSASVFMPLSTQCVDCHRKDFETAKSPDHIAAGFDTDCTTCHTIRSWQGARFTHTADFPLTGGHAGVDCVRCHKGGDFAGLSTECATCHLSDFRKVKEPDHVALGFSHDCVECHNIRSWNGFSEGAKLARPRPRQAK